MLPLRARLTLLPLALAASMANAQTAPTPAQGATTAPTSPWSFQLRYRHESVADDAFARHAEADTLRMRIGFKHAFGNGWSTFVEAEGVAELNDNFNSSANGETSYPLVPDARALELNQAYVDWRGKAVGTRIGRQSIVLDNARFVGNVAWRQNMQTFDGVQVQWKPHAKVDIQGYWLGRVHRVNGDEALDPRVRERELDARLLRAQVAVPGGALVGYGYWVEDLDVASASTRTLGVRYTGAWPVGDTWKVGVTAEAARQSPYADAVGGDTRYVSFEPRLERGPLVFKAGFERLGAGDGRAFQTPLATLHAFNGWADKFLVTPTNGLEDRYVSAQGAFKLAGRSATWQVMAHDFQSDHGVDYGREWDASLGMTFRPGLTGLVKAADYRSDGFARDTRKVWLQLEWSF